VEVGNPASTTDVEDIGGSGDEDIGGGGSHSFSFFGKEAPALGPLFHWVFWSFGPFLTPIFGRHFFALFCLFKKFISGIFKSLKTAGLKSRTILYPSRTHLYIE
jgi:hypothetical protein